MASELVHNATLLHDDVLDGAKTRRGRIAAHLKYDAHTAILSGDALLCKAMADVARLGDCEILENLALTLRELVEGECLQADLVGKVHEELDTVLEVCRRKTGALFAWGGWVAGKIAGRNAEELRKFGKHLGLAFQLLDDVLDWESDSSGKPRLQDLREAKLNTVAVVLAMKSSSARQILQRAFSSLDSHQEIESPDNVHIQLKSCPEFLEAVQWVKAQAEKESAFAIANLESLPDSPWKELAKRLTTDLLTRMK
jgi:octaprenyl-diphosphate synthase